MDATHSSQLHMTDASESSVERDIKQRAATSLFDPSVLLFHSLSMNESPTKTRLRMLRHLTGQPQPPHDHAPSKLRPSHSSSTSHPYYAKAKSGDTSSSTQAPSTTRPRRDNIPVDDEFAHTFFQGRVD
ncbi:hypothetical protein MVEG_05023 [Podila verticillata NRRL 6337]|nr:MAG: hypothetical protein BYD32DRAFT_246316 [Podila humilis]KFH68204.1 hypothetical protein MVEG_05023 [Podila verticillata NRRL 6337]